ncbi:MAG: C1 family peptidase [Fimbriimonadaceae bacterium]|nr:C1 family peptidase [Fimbriimonadaceae bacterium]
MATTPAARSVELDAHMLAECRTAFASDPRNRQAMNALCTTPLAKAALNRSRVVLVDHSFSHHLKEGASTSQNQSGRCWLFAALNTLRAQARSNMNVGDEFELSQSYLTFWDKFEKANFFLESILGTLEEPEGSRLLSWLLASPIQDGGQWHMFVSLVKKYGVVPKTVMPETDSSSATGPMVFQVTHVLRDAAWRLRRMASEGSSEDALRATKNAAMKDVYRMLAVHLGEPPTRFHWQWRDKDRAFVRDGEITPQEFYERHLHADLDQKICLIHDPRPQHPFNRLYTVQYLGNVVGGDPIAYVNVEMPVMKRAAIAQLVDGEPVWFGNDVGKHLDRDLGVMDLEIHDTALLYGVTPTIDKAGRLSYGQSQMTHAMVFTGVDLDEAGRPLKWRVENSWGDKCGDKGYLQMTDRWFDEYMYEVVVDQRHVSDEVRAVLEQEPIELDPWDPMGSLA